MKKYLAVAVIVLFLTSPIVSSTQIERENNKKILSERISHNVYSLLFNSVKWPFFTFNSYIDLKYDASLLNDPIPIDKSTYIPMNITYWTDIPRIFLWFFPWQIRNLILFFRFINPMQKIYLKVLNEPEWANIYFTTPEILVDIPFLPDRIEKSVSLLITPRDIAPSESYQLKLDVSCDDIGRINGFNYTETVEFTPEYFLAIQISSPQHTICPQNQTTIIPINVTNRGNWFTRINGEIFEYPEGFVLALNPPFIDIEIFETKQFFLSVYPYNSIGENVIPLKFTAHRQPYWYGSPIGNYSYYVIVDVI